MDISQVRPYEQNAKKHPKAQVDAIARSIQEFGFNQPIVVDKNREIIVGHGRYYAAQQLGLQDVPVTVLENLTDDQVMAYRLADNKLNESEWDMGLAIENLKYLDSQGYDITLTGFDRDLILESDEKDDQVPDNAPPRAKLGDVWALGRHRLMCGDSTSLEAVQALMGDNKADMVFTDPPYNVDYEGMQNSKQWDKIRNDSKPPEEFAEFLGKAFKNYHEFSKGEAAHYICHADKSHKEFRQAFEQSGYEWRATIIWVKNSPAFNFAQYKYAHEPIFYCFKRGETVSWYGDLTNSTVWKEKWDSKKIAEWVKSFIAEGKTTIWHAKKEKGKHPTIKPIELITKAIFNSSKKDDAILDLFGGSGSTLIAAEKTGRIAYLMELDPKYCDVIIERYEQYTGNTAEKLS